MMSTLAGGLRPGDIFLTRGDSFVSRGIRFFSKTGGESRTEVNHAGIVVTYGTQFTSDIVEASSTVKMHKFNRYRLKKSTKVAIFRPINVTEQDLEDIALRAQTYVGRKYGYIKIVAHFLDWCLGGRYFFRRFAFMERYPICSWVVAGAYAEVGLGFGVEVGEASPDDIWDFVTSNPDKYEMVHPLRMLP